MYLLDTDIYSLFRRGQEKAVRRARHAGSTSPIGITIITKLEILRGRIEFMLKASDRQQLFKAQALFLFDEAQMSQILVQPMNDKALDFYFDFQKTKGLKKVGRNDLLIGCIALAHKAVLVTPNIKDFRLVPRLIIENWAD
jgi:tRNA(fMet)-specific endonuclease VapC